MAIPRPAAALAAVGRPVDGRGARGGLWLTLLAGLLVGTAALMVHFSRGLTFNLDEWLWVTERDGYGPATFVKPHNNHLSLVPLLVFRGLLELVGLDAHWVMMLPLIALQLTLGALLFVIARRRVGPGVAVGVAALAMLSGLAFENFLIPGQIGQMASVVAGVAAFALLDRPSTRRTDLGIGGLVVVALASSGMGIPVLVGVSAELALTRSDRRRLWVTAAPLAVYVLWYLAYGRATPGWTTSSSLRSGHGRPPAMVQARSSASARFSRVATS